MKTKKLFQLTNKDIADSYKSATHHLMIQDFTSAFACWAVCLNRNGNWGAIADATRSYDLYLRKKVFNKIDKVVEMDYAYIQRLTSETLFTEIAEIVLLNRLEPDFICIGALSRNVFFHILREKITQPLP